VVLILFQEETHDEEACDNDEDGRNNRKGNHNGHVHFFLLLVFAAHIVNVGSCSVLGVHHGDKGVRVGNVRGLVVETERPCVY